MTETREYFAARTAAPVGTAESVSGTTSSTGQWARASRRDGRQKAMPSRLRAVTRFGQLDPSTGARMVRPWIESGAGSTPNAPSGTLIGTYRGGRLATEPSRAAIPAAISRAG